MDKKNILTIKGHVQSGSGLYISRHADKQLYELCRHGKPAYVLSSRQTGKSSLMFNVSRILNSKGITTVVIDLSQLTTESAEQWYLAFLSRIVHRLHVNINSAQWWKAQGDLENSKKMVLFFQQVLLRQFTKPFVIFIDQIQCTMNLPFATDDFYRAIRELFDLRPRDMAMEKLNFVLLGSASPHELTGHLKNSPFAVCTAVALDDFNLKEIAPLVKALDMPTSQLRLVLKDMYKWTHGHPYLTQLLCYQLSKQNIQTYSPKIIETLVRNLMSDNKVNESLDEHFSWIQNRLVETSDAAIKISGFNPRKSEILRLYKKVLGKQGEIRDNDDSALIQYLKLSGVLRSQNGFLFVRNKIYEKLLSPKWISENRISALPNWLRPKYIAVIALILILFSGIWMVMKQFPNIPVTDNFELSEEEKKENEAWQAFKVKIALAVANVARRLRGEEDIPFNEIEPAQKEESDLSQIPGKLTRSFNRLAVSEPKKKNSELNLVWDKTLESLQSELETGVGDKETRGNLLDRDLVQHVKREKRVLQRFDNRITAFEVDNQHKQMITAEGNQVHLMDLETGAITHSVSSNDRLVESMILSGDGKIMATASGNGIQLRDANTLEELQVLGFSEPVQSMALSPDGKSLAIGVGKSIQVMNTQLGIPVKQMDVQGPVHAMSFSPDGKSLAATLADNQVGIWSTRNLEQTAILKDHKSPVSSVRFTPDSKKMISADKEGAIQIHDAETWNAIGLLESKGSIEDLIIHPEGKQLASTTREGSVLLWNFVSGELLMNFDGNHDSAMDLAFDEDGNLMVLSPDGQSVEKWDTNDLQEPSSFSIPQGPVKTLMANDDYTYLADGTLYRMPIDDIQRIEKIDIESPISKVKFYPNLNAVLITTDDGIQIMDLDQYEPQSRIPINISGISDMDLSFNGQQIIIATSDAIHLYNPLTGDLIQSRSVPNDIRSINFSPTGDTFLTGSDDGIIDVRNVNGFDRQVILAGHRSGVNRILVNDVDEPVFSASNDSTVIMWNGKTYEKHHTFKGHTGAVNDLVYLPDNRVLMSASSDHTIMVWDVDSGSELAILKGHYSPVISLSYDPDRNIVTSISEDSHVRRWDMTLVNGLKPGKSRSIIDELYKDGAGKFDSSFK